MTTNREEIPSSYFLVEAHSLPPVATKLKELGLLVSDDVEKMVEESFKWGAIYCSGQLWLLLSIF